MINGMGDTHTTGFISNYMRRSSTWYTKPCREYETSFSKKQSYLIVQHYLINMIKGMENQTRAIGYKNCENRPHICNLIIMYIGNSAISANLITWCNKREILSFLNFDLTAAHTEMMDTPLKKLGCVQLEVACRHFSITTRPPMPSLKPIIYVPWTSQSGSSQQTCKEDIFSDRYIFLVAQYNVGLLIP